MITIISKEEPQSLNHIYKARAIYAKGKPIATVYLCPKAKKYKDDFRKIAAEQYKGDPIIDDVRVKATCFFGTKRKKDIQNCLKVELDALNNLVWIDDSQIVELLIIKKYEKDNGGLVLEIERI